MFVSSNIKKLIIFLSLLISPSVAHALSCTVYEVSGGTGNYNSTTNWSASSGGASGASVPTSSSVVCLDSNSGNLTVNVTSAAGSILMTGGVGATGNYTGTLTFSATLTVTNGTITWNSGATIAGSGTLAYAGSVTYNPAGLSVPNFTTTGSGTVTMGGDVSISGTLATTIGTNPVFSGAHNLTTATFYMPCQTASSQSLTFPAGQTLTITSSLFLVEGQNSQTTSILSGTSSSSFNFNYSGTLSNEHVDNITFTDTNASGSSFPIYNYFGGTLTRTTNITNVDASNLNPPGTINNTFSGVTVASGGSLSVN